ncbi:unnamed protein product [Hymenolepis diminuta]|uniref:Uncharacterized protein n=1 Tax=Hymenolepis diminuta TaxID=6216 RepID=A0A564YI15_HYMDI|nr:unnamed protein product [Hymenolepis diminuta]
MYEDEMVSQARGNLTISFVYGCFYPNIGGVENHIYRLAQCLVSHGHKYIVVTLAYGIEWQRQVQSLMYAKALGLCALFTDHLLFGFTDLSPVLVNRALNILLSVVDNIICVPKVPKENAPLIAHMEPERT